MESGSAIAAVSQCRMWGGSIKYQTLPLSVADIHTMSKEHADKLAATHPKDGARRNVLINGIMESMAANEKDASDENSKLLVFDDENQDNELVYSISIEPVRKRVVVVFRGSVTKEDWKVDSRAWQIKVPLEDGMLDGFDYVTLHKGFYEYLFKETASGQTKYEIIMDQVRPLLAEHPGYQLYVKGHSLGGALCTLFSIYASLDKSIIKPVSCFTFGAPKVGTHTFLQLVQVSDVLDIYYLFEP